jgi:di/tricarboxylate transporter
MLDLAGSSRLRLLVVTMTGTALLSGFISNTGTVATLLPAVTSAAWAVGSVPSKFLMPLAFAANTGGLLTLTGTPPNIIVSETLVQGGFEPFGYFEFALIGLPLLITAVLYMVIIGRRLLPRRKAGERPPELSETMDELAEDYSLDGRIFRLRVRRGSSLVGQTLDEASLGHDYNISVLSIDRPGDDNGRGSLQRIQGAAHPVRRPQRVGDPQESLQPVKTPIPGPETEVQAGDVMLVSGLVDSVQRLAVRYNLAIQPAGNDNGAVTEILLSQEVGLAQVLIAPRSVYIGRTVSGAHFAEKFDVQVLSIRRGRHTLDRRQVKLTFGDALLVRGTWEAIELLQNEKRNFVVVGSPESMARQIVELSSRSAIAILALLGMIILMVTGLVPTVIAALMAAIGMVLGGCLTMGQAYRAINWRSVVLLAAMIPMSVALFVTGGVDLVAEALVNSLGSVGPIALMAGIFLLTTTLSQVMNNSATAVLLAPVVFQASQDMGVSPYPMLMIVAVSASTAFLTPIGTTTNLMVSTPGGYGFRDYMRVGLPLVAIFMVVSLLLVPLIWPL